MPSRWRTLLCAAGVAVAAVIAAKMWTTPRKGPWKPLWQPPSVPKLVKGRSYFFLTHHKTGTNLMQRFCNITAIASTGWTDECAFCLRGQRPVKGKEHLGIGCLPDPTPEHGKLRGTIDRFTLLSSIHGREAHLILQFHKDFRAVHMIRHPVAMAISAHQYNKFVSSPQGKKWRWDMSAQDIENATTLREELLIEAKAIQRPIDDMITAHELMKDDPRVLTLDLDHHFEETFNATAERLFRHMFADAPGDIEFHIATASFHDKRGWTKKQQQQPGATAGPRFLMNRTSAILEWKKLEEEGHPDVLKVLSFAEQLGYPREWTPVKGPRD